MVSKSKFHMDEEIVLQAPTRDEIMDQIKQRIARQRKRLDEKRPKKLKMKECKSKGVHKLAKMLVVADSSR